MPLAVLSLVRDILELNYCTKLFHQTVHTLSAQLCKTRRNIVVSRGKHHSNKTAFSIAFFAAFSAFFPHFSAFFANPGDRISPPPSGEACQCLPKWTRGLGTAIMSSAICIPLSPTDLDSPALPPPYTLPLQWTSANEQVTERTWHSTPDIQTTLKDPPIAILFPPFAPPPPPFMEWVRPKLYPWCTGVRQATRAPAARTSFFAGTKMPVSCSCQASATPLLPWFLLKSPIPRIEAGGHLRGVLGLVAASGYTSVLSLTECVFDPRSAPAGHRAPGHPEHQRWWSLCQGWRVVPLTQKGLVNIPDFVSKLARPPLTPPPAAPPQPEPLAVRQTVHSPPQSALRPHPALNPHSPQRPPNALPSHKRHCTGNWLYPT